MLKYLADENFPADAIKILKAKKYDIVWIGDMMPGCSDEEVLQLAMRDERVLITFDKDFGELAFKEGLPATCGIILFRIPLLPPIQLVTVIEEVLSSRSDWPGHFSVVDMRQIRMRQIQTGK